MTQHVLISGSVAFDTIMVFDGYFKDHILPERVHQINISMLTPELKRESGGCAANIAYNLRLLGGTPAILATVGKDGAEYAEQLGAMGIDTRQLLVLPEFFTPQAFVTTDKAANQIAAFHPGAMNEAHRARVDAFPRQEVSWGIASPNGHDAFVQHCDQFEKAGIPFICDPGQSLPILGGRRAEEDDPPGHRPHRQRLRVRHGLQQDRLDRGRGAGSRRHDDRHPGR